MTGRGTKHILCFRYFQRSLKTWLGWKVQASYINIISKYKVTKSKNTKILKLHMKCRRFQDAT